MKQTKVFFTVFMGLILVLVVTVFTGWAQPSPKYELSIADLEKYKTPMDDPSPFYKNIEGYKKIMPTDVYKKVIYDIETMKKSWAEVVGFTAPNVVGKVAPEIVPGKYSYKDKSKFPFEKIMWKHMYDWFNAPPTSGPRHVGYFTEIEVVPTRQYYWALPVAEATKKYMESVKQDNQGYLVKETYMAGYPFPRPSGPHKAQQIIYNWDKSYWAGDSNYYLEDVFGFTRDLREDYRGIGAAYAARLHGRVLMEPYGWFDERARVNGESGVLHYWSLAPRDVYGNTISITSYIDPNKDDLLMVYIGALRRIRKLTASDSQDPAVGPDVIYEDGSGFFQKLSPTRYPYKYEMIGEGEYLAPITVDGSPYMSKKEGHTIKQLQFERRPVWVVQMTQLDRHYVYSKRIWWVDKEFLLPYHIENFDQKGRLYRTWTNTWGFIPEMGLYNQFHVLALDHIDTHSTAYHSFSYPAAWLSRADISLSGLVKAK